MLEGYEVGQSEPRKINVLDAFDLAIPVWMINVQKEAISNCFRHCNIRSSTDATRNYCESTFDAEMRDLETMINQCGYRNKMNIDNLMNYSGENESCSEVQSLEEIVYTMIEYNTEDEVLLAFKTLQNFMLQF